MSERAVGEGEWVEASRRRGVGDMDVIYPVDWIFQGKLALSLREGGVLVAAHRFLDAL